MTAIAVAIFLCATGWAQGNWNTTNGNWSVASNWNPAIVPANGYSVSIQNNDSVSRSVNYDVYGSKITLSTTILDQDGSGSLTLYETSVIGGGEFLTATTLFVGYSGKADFENSDLQNTVVNILEIGSGVGSSGIYNLYGYNPGDTSLQMGSTGIEYIGQSGTGVLTNTGAPNGYGATLDLGDGSTGVGTYNLSGGSAGALSGTGPEFIGFKGKGTFIQSGGSSNTVGGELDIAARGGAVGSYTISNYGSALTVNGTGLYVGGSSSGAGGAGTLTVGTGATVTANGTLQIYPGTSNSVVLNGGTISAGSFNLASLSQFHWNNGTVGFLNGMILDTSSNANFGSASSLTLQTGQGIVGYGEAIGYSGSGSITQIGGTNVIPALISGGEYALNIGPLAGSTGNYNLSGGSLSMQGNCI